MKPKKLVCGVGINNANYVVKKFETIGHVDGKKKQKQTWVCPYYKTWKHMLMRCYDAKYQDSRPTYKKCTVSDNWLTLTNFKGWMEKQNWEGLQLDKDLLIEGNKVYSPETCVFVAGVVNSFVNDQRAKRGEWQLGVDWDKRRGKFRSRCRNPFTNRENHLGYFTCEMEAHQAWLKRKLELAHELAAIQTDQRVAKALIERYSKPYINEARK